MIPIRTDSRLRTTPWMNYAIIAANVLVFLLQHLFSRLTPALELSPRHPSLLGFFTYSLLHANAGHIAGNMLFLYIFGNNVNDKMGHLAYLAFYVAGGIVAGIFYALGGDSIAVIGASGAVSAVTGAYLVLFPRANVTILFFMFYITVFELQSVWFIAFFFAKDLVTNFSGASSGVAHMAHIGGTLFGFSVCFGLLMFNLLPRDHFDVVALVKQWNRRRQFRAVTASGYNPFAITHKVGVENRLPAPRTPQQEKAMELKLQITETIAAHDQIVAAQLYLQMHKLDPEQVLGRQAQLDVANQLASQQLYADAAEAYELFLRHYRNFEQVEQVELMLGLIYARYLNRYAAARECLIRAMARLHNDREIQLARGELARVEVMLAAS